MRIFDGDENDKAPFSADVRCYNADPFNTVLEVADS